MTELHNVKRVFNVIDNSLFMITGKLDYDRVTDAIIKLADMVHRFPLSVDGYELWDIGEHRSCCLADLIVGAYWHYTEWHGGQSSQGYHALSALDRVFTPNMSMCEDDNEAYQALNQMAK